MFEMWEAAYWRMQNRNGYMFPLRSERSFCQRFLRLCSKRSKSQGSDNQQKTVQARVFALTPDNAKIEDMDAGVVTGTIPLFNSLVYTLFDYGATHSFVSTTYAKLCSMSMEPLRQNITIVTPVGKSLLCSKVVVDCSIIIEERTLLANLVVFEMD